MSGPPPILGYDSVPFEVRIKRTARTSAGPTEPLGYDSLPFNFKPNRTTDMRKYDEDRLSEGDIETILTFARERLSPAAVQKLLQLIEQGQDTEEDFSPGEAQKRQQATAETRDVMSAMDCLACDGAAGIYRQALRRMGMPQRTGMASDSLRAIFVAHRDSRRSKGLSLRVTDLAADERIDARFPHLAHIGRRSL